MRAILNRSKSGRALSGALLSLAGLGTALLIIIATLMTPPAITGSRHADMAISGGLADAPPLVASDHRGR